MDLYAFLTLGSRQRPDGHCYHYGVISRQYDIRNYAGEFVGGDVMGHYPKVVRPLQIEGNIIRIAATERSFYTPLTAHVSVSRALFFLFS
jgi:hypothetical protein